MWGHGSPAGDRWAVPGEEAQAVSRGVREPRLRWGPGKAAGRIRSCSCRRQREAVPFSQEEAEVHLRGTCLRPHCPTPASFLAQMRRTKAGRSSHWNFTLGFSGRSGLSSPLAKGARARGGGGWLPWVNWRGAWEADSGPRRRHIYRSPNPRGHGLRSARLLLHRQHTGPGRSAAGEPRWGAKVLV